MTEEPQSSPEGPPSEQESAKQPESPEIVNQQIQTSLQQKAILELQELVELFEVTDIHEAFRKPLGAGETFIMEADKFRYLPNFEDLIIEALKIDYLAAREFVTTIHSRLAFIDMKRFDEAFKIATEKILEGIRNNPHILKHEYGFSHRDYTKLRRLRRMLALQEKELEAAEETLIRQLLKDPACARQFLLHRENYTKMSRFNTAVRLATECLTQKS